MAVEVKGREAVLIVVTTESELNAPGETIVPSLSR
jgi:hypothetical protein